MNLLQSKISIGAENLFEIFHISDTHLTLADERDNERKRELAERRSKSFPAAESVLSAVIELSRRQKIPVMCTGDLIDFVSEANLDAVKRSTFNEDFFTCAGNHEFSQYVGEAWEDETYRNQSLAKVQAVYSNNIRFASRVINGVNFVAVDNSYYLFEPAQLECLKKEAALGLPLVVMLHVPLYTPELFNYVMNELGHEDAGLMAVPEGLIRGYSDYRFRQQNADRTTLEAYEYIMQEKSIRLVITGHLHFDYECSLPSGVTQLITGCETVRKISFC